MDNMSPSYYVLLVCIILPLSAAFVPYLMSRKITVSRYLTSGTTLDVKTAKKLKGKNVIITGASSGLGRAIALELVKCELKHMVISGRNVQALEEVRRACETEDTSCKVHIIPCDLADLDASKLFAKEALQKCEGCVDMLVLSGGISSRSSFLETSAEVDGIVMKVNFLSGASIAKCIVPAMVEKKCGSLVWISSIQGLIGTPFRTSYAASKFAVQGYCEALRSELASSGVAVYCVSPGYINTNLSLNAVTGDGLKYGKMDNTTANGADPRQVAVEIIDTVLKQRKSDFVVAATPDAKVALLLKSFAPKALERILSKRFVKLQKNTNK